MKIQEFDYSVDLLQSILWQYNEAANLQSLIEQKQAWYDINQSEFWNDWYTDVFNLETANFFGLSVWSIILNVPLFVPVDPEPNDKPIWGFNRIVSFPTLENTYLNFNNSNFSTRGQVIVLTLEEQRFILRLRYFQLVSNGTTYTNEADVTKNSLYIPGINKFLAYLTSTSDIDPNGNIYALDDLDMSMTYIFTFLISEALQQVLMDLDLLPRPAGVGIKYVVATGKIWGFGPFNQNFENGNFIPDPFV